MAESYEKRLKEVINTLSSIKETIETVSKNIKEIHSRKQQLLSDVKKNCENSEKYADLMLNDNNPLPYQFTEICILEIKYLISIKNSSNKFFNSLISDVNSAPQRISESGVETGENMLLDMRYSIEKNIGNIINSVSSQIDNTRVSRTKKIMLHMKFYRETYRKSMISQFDKFIKDLKDEETNWIELRTNLQEIRRNLEKFLPLIPKMKKITEKNIDKVDSSVRSLVRSSREDDDYSRISIASSGVMSSLDSGISNVTSDWNAGGGSFGGGGASGSW